MWLCRRTAVERPGSGGPIAEVKYALRPDRSSYLPVVYRVKSDGSLVEAKKEDDAALRLQWALSTRMLSLWDAARPEAVADRH